MQGLSETTADNGDSPDRLLLDVRETAQLLSVSPSTVWRVRKKGLLPAVKIEGAVRFRLFDVQEYVTRLEGG